jgi:hypothetical protein
MVDNRQLFMHTFFADLLTLFGRMLTDAMSKSEQDAALLQNPGGEGSSTAPHRLLVELIEQAMQQKQVGGQGCPATLATAGGAEVSWLLGVDAQEGLLLLVDQCIFETATVDEQVQYTVHHTHYTPYTIHHTLYSYCPSSVYEQPLVNPSSPAPATLLFQQIASQMQVKVQGKVHVVHGVGEDSGISGVGVARRKGGDGSSSSAAEGFAWAMLPQLMQKGQEGQEGQDEEDEEDDDGSAATIAVSSTAQPPVPPTDVEVVGVEEAGGAATVEGSGGGSASGNTSTEQSADQAAEREREQELERAMAMRTVTGPDAAAAVTILVTQAAIARSHTSLRFMPSRYSV